MTEEISSLKILSPIFPKKQTIYFRGYLTNPKPFHYVIYITMFTLDQNELSSKNVSNLIYGCCGESKLKSNKITANYLLLSSIECPYIRRLLFSGAPQKVPQNCTIIFYDLMKIRDSQVIPNTNQALDNISTLRHFIKADLDFDNMSMDAEKLQLIEYKNYMSTSMFLSHLTGYVNLWYWLIKSFTINRRIDIKQANFILTVLLDLTLGFFVLSLLVQDKQELSKILMDVLEKLVNSLYSLLGWLMGVPAGLKLNNAFNKMLGKYFSYHIQLWWLFLDVSGEKLDVVLQVFEYLGYVGISFQAALLCDIICLATFHSYCIYVYAARIFNLQISGLIALLRLFVGRKFNPLRGGVDSCEYTNQELFVGTVAFTILLLLLPTTAMYYTVFTMFRLLSLSVQFALAKVIYFIQTMPLYVTFLWMIRSPKIAGKVLIESVQKEGFGPLVLRLKILPKTLASLVGSFTPPVKMATPVQWTNLLTNLLRGQQIV